MEAGEREKKQSGEGGESGESGYDEEQTKDREEGRVGVRHA